MERKLKLKLSNQEWSALIEMLQLFPVAKITPAGKRDMVVFIMSKVATRLINRELKRENTLTLKAHEIAAMEVVLQLMVQVMDPGVYETNIIDRISDSFCRWQADRYAVINNIKY